MLQNSLESSLCVVCCLACSYEKISMISLDLSHQIPDSATSCHETGMCSRALEAAAELVYALRTMGKKPFKADLWLLVRICFTPTVSRRHNLAEL